MPLISSLRHRPDDLRRWRFQEGVDEYVAARIKWDALVDPALALIVDFARSGPCFAFTSWGKDSTVLAHMIFLAGLRYGVRVPLVYCRIEPLANPDSDQVRDAFLARFDVDYREGAAAYTPETWAASRSWAEGGGWTSGDESPWYTACRLATGTTYWATRRISGIRAVESKARKMSIGHKGLITKSSCSPIGKWSTEKIWAYLYRHHLPVHPVYACSQGGMWDRDWLRVDMLARGEGDERGRAEWERRYYGNEIRHIEKTLAWEAP